MTTTNAGRGSGTKRTKRHELGDRSREEILDAASKLMSVKGYSATSISELARTSGLPASSIYWHFDSKAGVLAAVMERGARHYFDEVRSILVPPEPDPAVTLRNFMESSNAIVRSHPEFLRLFMLLLLGSEGVENQSEVIRRVREEGRAHVHNALTLAYQPWGRDAAVSVADRLTDFTLALFDGVFLASQVDDTSAQALLVTQICDSVDFLAGAWRPVS